MMIGKPTEIGSPVSPARSGSATTAAGNTAIAGDGKVENVLPTDSVKLSDAGRAMTSPVRAEDAFRADKVAAVKQAIEQGTYKIQARVVAERMISEAAELLESMSATG